MSRIGVQVKKARQARGMTGKQLAKMVGVTEKFIEEIESGKKVMGEDLIKRISKVLGQEISEVMLYADEKTEETAEVHKTIPAAVKAEKQEVWLNALDSVLRAVPVYAYDMNKIIETRQLPVVSNKIEGYQKDKVLFLQIQDDSMMAFRMAKGDTAFGYLTSDVENNAFCLVECNGVRAVRQVKKLDGEKLLLISNKGSVVTETVSVKNLKVLARLVRVEILLK